MRVFVALMSAVVLFVTPSVSGAQQAPVGACGPGPSITGVCPPTGNMMGESNYQRATHGQYVAQPPEPAPAAPQAQQPTEQVEPIPYIEPSGAGAELYETTPLPNSITVDSEFVYVLRGNEVVKLSKGDMKVVSVTKLPASGD